MNIIRLFTKEQVQELKALVQNLKWSDGKGSALGTAKDKKKNLQSYPGTPEFDPIDKMVRDAFREKLRPIVFPAQIIGLRASLYRAGNGEYDWHVDMSHMQGFRTDISFTIFVSDRDVYEGGELDIESNGLNFSVKGDSGEIVLYSTGDRHRVREVTKGDRVVIVGWVSSLIPNETHRNLLIKIRTLHKSLENANHWSDEELAEALEKNNELYHQLVREFSH